MTRFALTLATIATATLLASAPPALAQSSDAGFRVAQADVNIRVNTPSTTRKKVIIKKRPAVRKKTVIRTTGRNCRTVTVRKRVGNRTVVSKTRRCS
jgi:hypothetical protein